MEEWWNDICTAYGILWIVMKITIPTIIVLYIISVYLSSKIKKRSSVRELNSSEIEESSRKILENLDIAKKDKAKYEIFLSTVMKEGVMKLSVEKVSNSPLQNLEEVDKEKKALKAKTNEFFLLKTKTIFCKEYWKYGRYT